MAFIYRKSKIDRCNEFERFRENVDNILIYRDMFPRSGKNEIDAYLARINYHRRFGRSLQDARELAFFSLNPEDL